MVTIAISGFHGTGKSTAAKALADEYDLKYVSAGQVFRQMAEEHDMSLPEFSEYVEENPEIDQKIDQRTASEAEKDNVLLDGRLAGWMAEEADIKLLLTAPLETRVQRIADREDRPFDEVMKETIKREESEEERYEELYGINVTDHSDFDLVLNTGKFYEDQMIRLLKKAVDFVMD